MRRRGFTSGFTLVELLIALVVSGVVLLGARMLWESLAETTRRLSHAAATAQARANGDRLLRTLAGRLEVGTDQSREFAGDERAVHFTTWCDMPAGWLERCDAALAIEAVSDSESAVVAYLSTGEADTLRRGFRAGRWRYLNDPVSGGVWFRIWGHGITAPLAFGLLTDGDTTIVRIGERG